MITPLTELRSGVASESLRGKKQEKMYIIQEPVVQILR